MHVKTTSIDLQGQACRSIPFANLGDFHACLCVAFMYFKIQIVVVVDPSKVKLIKFIKMA